MHIPSSRIIAIGAPLLLSAIALVKGYNPDPHQIPWVVLGWGSLFLGIMIAYHEWSFEKFVRIVSRRHSYEVMQLKYIPVLTQIESLVQSAEAGDEIFSTATFPLSEDYERKLIHKVVELANAGQGETVFTRIISNTQDDGIRAWIAQIKDPNHPVYSTLHGLITTGRVKIYTQHDPIGLDLLMIAGQKRKTVLIGVKEEHPSQYLNNHFARLIPRGRTFLFENDDLANSIYCYYGKFICEYLESTGNRMIL